MERPRLYRVYDVTGGGRAELGEVSPDTTHLLLPPLAGHTVAVVAVDQTESRDVTAMVPAPGSFDIVANGSASTGGLVMTDAPGTRARPMDVTADVRLNPTRDRWLSRWYNRVSTCPIRTEVCSTVIDLGDGLSGPGVLMEATWLPDGRILLLRGQEPASRSLWTVRQDGTGLARLVSVPNLRQITPAPSGAEVVGMDDQFWQLARVRLTDGKRTLIPNTEKTDEFTVSTQGKLVVSSTKSYPTNGSEIRVMNLDGTASKTMPLPIGDTRYVTFDPTGTKVAWVRNRAFMASTVWIANADGSQARELNSAIGPWHHLVWSLPDTAAPVASITGPAVSARQVTLSVGATDPDSASGSLRRQCRLDQSLTWSACGASWALSGLSVGTNVAYVRVTDPVGHVSAQKSLTWRVDGIAPKAAVTALSPTQLASSMRLAWTSTDEGGAGVKSHDVRLRTARLSAGFGPYTYPTNLQGLTSRSATIALTQGNQYCFSVRARDKVGNLGVWSPERCTVAALDDRRLSASSGWTRAGSSSYAFGTYTTTTRAGATLSKTSVQGKRFSVIATTCATCGALDVYHAGRKLGRINLYSPNTRTRQELFLPTQSVTRTGTLKIRTINRKRVHIDALVVRH
ncbi:MAG: hypothetical protein ACTHJJ_03525 [Intrasporangium sp.]|uniref:hypothetical protein n=1 Tax=Intrasporangium sp. TaxID=1925024 RepID=UPI003F7FAA8A